MTPRRILFIGFPVLAAIAVAGWIAWTRTHDRVLEPRFRMPRALLADPWLPAKRLLGTRHVQIGASNRLETALALAHPGETIVFQGGWGDELPLAAAGRLRGWVRAGGRLVTSASPLPASLACWLDDLGLRLPDRDEAEDASESVCPEGWREGVPASPMPADSGTDPSGQAFGEGPLHPDDADPRDASPPSPPQASPMFGPDGAGTSLAPAADTTPPPSGEAPSACRPAETDSVGAILAEDGDTLRIPGSGDYRIHDASSAPLRWTRRDPAGWVEASGFLGEVRTGRGSVAVVGSFAPFTRTSIADADHASLFLRLVAPEPPAAGSPPGLPPRVWFVRDEAPEAWPLVLWHRAWPALLALVAGLILGLWAAFPRRGARLRPDDALDASGEGMLRHAQASGRWLDALPEGRAELSRSLRAASLRRIRSRHPEWTGLAPAALASTLARELPGCDPADLREALAPDAPDSPTRFLKLARVHWRIRRLP